MASLLDEQLGDVEATLDAAFALIDACLPSPRASSDSEQPAPCQTSTGSCGLSAAEPRQSDGESTQTTSTSGAESQTDGAAQASRRSKKPTTHQIRQREEILRLRNEVAELTAQLCMMESTAKSATGSSAAVGIRGSKAPTGFEVMAKRAGCSIRAITLWRDIATRQKKLRGNSEAENSRLRTMLSEQRKAIRSIKRLIIRETERKISPYQHSNPGHQLVGMDRLVMEHLYEELNEIYERVDDILQRFGLSSASVIPTQHRFVQLSATKYAALIMESRIMPFSYQTAANAMWELTLGICNGRVPNFGLKASAVVGDTVFRSYAVDRLRNHREFSSAGDHAVRKYVEASRIVFITNGRGQPRAVNGADSVGIEYREVGRIVIAPVSGQDECASPMCCLRWCMEITATIEEESKGKLSRALAFLRILMAHKVSAHEEFSEALEGILLRQSAPTLRV